MRGDLTRPGPGGAWTHTWASIIELAESLSRTEFALPTRCPGWDVHDQLAHVASLERLLAGGELPAGGARTRRTSATRSAPTWSAASTPCAACRRTSWSPS